MHRRGTDHAAIAAAFEAVRDNNANAPRRSNTSMSGAAVPDRYEAETSDAYQVPGTRLPTTTRRTSKLSRPMMTSHPRSRWTLAALRCRR